VEHVTVNEGGQAIVGNITPGVEGLFAKNQSNLMKREYSFQKCSALLRNFKAHARAVQGSRGAGLDRFHGARGGAPKGKANGAYKHGLFMAEAIEERQSLRQLIMEAKQFVRDLGE
jgi:hypothetical protein